MHAIPAALRGPTAAGFTMQAASALKYRVFCGLLDQLNVTAFGQGCQSR